MNNQMIEIFLFIDPLGKRCNNVRKVIKKFRAERPEEIKIRVIPMVNFQKIYRHTKRESERSFSSMVDNRNHFSQNTYEACLAFHACSMQGKNMAHKFLTALQERVVEEGFSYSEELMYNIVRNIGLDVETFTEDYHSELTKKIYQKNLNIAAEMKVKGTPSCVIFNGNEKVAVRLNKNIENEMLHAICGTEQLNQNKLMPQKEIPKVLRLN